MANGVTVFEKLQEGLESLPTQQKQVCEFLLHNYRESAFLTVKAIAEKTGVGPATVIRTINNLGYPSFVDFQNCLHKIMISTNSSVWWRLEQSLSVDREKDGTLEQVIQENVSTITQCLSTMNIEAFKSAVERICGARHILILGMRSSRAVAEAFYIMCRQLLPNVRFPACLGSEHMYEELIDLESEDVLLAISAGGPHYAIRTIEAVEYARERGVPVILITDDLSNRAVPSASELICVSSTSTHFSLVPIMTILDALLVEIGKQKKGEVLDRLHSLEKVLIDKGINN